jgi:hypothetical protein
MHWEMLRNKLGSDIVSYCIQPYLLPVNGTTHRQKLQMIGFELSWLFFQRESPKYVYKHLINKMISQAKVGTLKARNIKLDMVCDFMNRYGGGICLKPSDVKVQEEEYYLS